MTSNVLGGALAAALILASAAASARVVRLEVTATQPYGSFATGEFVRVEGRIHGELAPDEPIPGLDRAARNGRGRVDYTAPFILIQPKDPAQGNGALLFDVANRGRPIAHHLYNSPRAVPVVAGSLEAGTGFLQGRGFTLVTVGWELGMGIELPGFAGPDGKTLHAEGAGIAAIRDTVDFLHNAAADDAGTPNPLAGAINRTLVVGYSQTARLLKTFLIEGFNMTEGRRVFDGVHLHASAGGRAAVLAVNAGPQSSSFFTPRFTDPDWRGVHEEPFTYRDIIERMTRRREVPPRILVTSSTTDYFSIRASLARTGASGTADQPVPPNVRLYDVAGASHERSLAPGCEKPRDTLDWFPVMRATLVNLDAWVSHNRPPPPSLLMPLAARPGDATVLQRPAHLPDAVIQVPTQGPDGNFQGGVRLPDVEAPLGTHGEQNLPLSDRSCNLGGSTVAFAPTPEQRAPGDTRPSLAERYKGRADYMEQVRAATRRLLQQRFLLPGDAAVIINAAAEAPGLK